MIQLAKITLAVLLSALFSLTALAQNGYYQDVPLYGQYNIKGTARTQAMGGIQAALGADLSSLTGNPAGLGLYRQSEVSLSPSLYLSNTSSTYLGNSLPESDANPALSNLGIVFAQVKDDLVQDEWRGGAFAIGYTKLKDFNQRFSYSGLNPENSFADFAAEQAASFGLPALQDQLSNGSYSLAGMAFYTYLVDRYIDDQGNDLYDRTDLDFNEVRQEETVNTSGGMNEFSMGYGGNFDDKFYFGVKSGINFINYTRNRTYRETVTKATFSSGLRSFTYSDELTVGGLGLNLAVGGIYRITDELRAGISLQTPTWYAMSENASKSSLTVNYNNFFYGVDNNTGEDIMLNTITDNTDEEEDYVYSMTMPARIGGGLSYFFGKNGFVGADVEWVLYDRARFNTNESDVTLAADNQAVTDTYRSALNWNIGGEYKYKIFAFRAGAGWQSSPFEVQDDEVDRGVLSLTAGMGVKLDNFYTDLAIVQSNYEGSYAPYTLSNGRQPRSINSYDITQFVITGGFYF